MKQTKTGRPHWRSRYPRFTQVARAAMGQSRPALKVADCADKTALDGLFTLTPADFLLVRRRAALVDTKSPEELTRLLAAECDGRIGGRLAVGFAASTHGDGDGG